MSTYVLAGTMDRPLTEVEEKRIFFYVKRHPKVKWDEVAKRYQRIFKLRHITNTALNACVVVGMLKGWDGEKKALYLYYSFTKSEVKVLLPRRVGKGFLKAPKVTPLIKEAITQAEHDKERPLKGIAVEARPGYLSFQISSKISKSERLRSRFGNSIIIPIRRYYGYCFEEEISNRKFAKILKVALST